MKNKSKILTAAFLAALLQTALSFGQSPESYAAPKESGVNFSLSLGGAYAQTTSISGGVWDNRKVDLFGAYGSFALRFGRHHKMQFDLGYLSGSKSESYNIGYLTGEDSLDYKIIPLLLSYEYCFLLGSRDRFEIHVGPTAGGYRHTVDAALTLGSSSVSIKNSEYGYSYGGRAGLTWHISPRLFVDATARYLRSASSFKDFDLTSTSATLSFGFKF
ncbi:MAG: outer membrane beta-barrel protein [Opitutaceae bacterium]|jgi:hypothetical protein|nr:outer membrane beta-barrel protein [Opitutaceae bacterium]